jgi:hypothetical protein
LNNFKPICGGVRERPCIELVNEPGLALAGFVGFHGTATAIRELGQQIDTEANQFATERAAAVPPTDRSYVDSIAQRLAAAKVELKSAEKRARDGDAEARRAVREGGDPEAAGTAAAAATADVVRLRRRAEELASMPKEAQSNAEAAAATPRRRHGLALADEAKRLLTEAQEAVAAVFREQLPKLMRGSRLEAAAKQLAG